MEFLLFKTIEEQRLVCFTGKVNILKKENNEFVGSLLLMDGEIVGAQCQKLTPLKAVFKLVLTYQKNLENLSLVIEPELLDSSLKKIDYPFKTLKKKMQEHFLLLQKTDTNRPPDNLKLKIKTEFIKSGTYIDPKEYSLLCVISDHNEVSEIYQESELFDYEITDLLVKLRKKNALKVIEKK